MKAKLDEWNAEIAKLEAKSKSAEADVQARYKEQMDALKHQRQQVEQNLEKIRTAGNNAWEDLKAGLDLAADALGEALRSAQSRFR
jgi:predicted  nucleic acid-binding Zn-ribbon protein